MTERELLQSYVSKPEVQNALRVIRFAEGTERGGPDSYRVMFGGGLAPDLKRHPDKVIKGGKYSSAAAGAYQFMPFTWEAQAKALGLSDFGQQSQDLAAVRLMRNRLMPIGGLSVLEKEGFSPKVSAALAPEWASLPTESGQSYYGQPVKKLSELQKVYGQTPQASPTSASTSTSQSTPEQTSGLFQGLMAALAANQPKELSVKDMFKQELMSQAFNPPRSNLLIDPFQMFLNTNLYE
jgi:muramidase (phage lysozyme)